MCYVGTEATAGLAPYTASDIKPPNRAIIPAPSQEHACHGKLDAEERSGSMLAGVCVKDASKPRWLTISHAWPFS